MLSVSQTRYLPLPNFHFPYVHWGLLHSAHPGSPRQAMDGTWGRLGSCAWGPLTPDFPFLLVVLCPAESSAGHSPLRVSMPLCGLSTGCVTVPQGCPCSSIIESLLPRAHLQLCPCGSAAWAEVLCAPLTCCSFGVWGELCACNLFVLLSHITTAAPC